MNKTVLSKYLCYLFSCSLVSCHAQKEDNRSPLTSSTWKVTSCIAAKPVDLNSRGNASTNLLTQSPSCINDDIYLFKKNGVFLVDDNNDVCTSITRVPGSWKLTGTDQLFVDFGGDGVKIRFRIVEISSRRMQLLARMPFVTGGVNVTYTYVPAGN